MNFWDFEGALYDERKGYAEPLRLDYKQTHRVINNGRELRATLRAGEYAWPGGYQMAFITSDGALLCFDCARKELYQIIWSIRNRCDDGWRIVGCDIVEDYESDEYCTHCAKQLAHEHPED